MFVNLIDFHVWLIDYANLLRNLITDRPGYVQSRIVTPFDEHTVDELLLPLFDLAAILVDAVLLQYIIRNMRVCQLEKLALILAHGVSVPENHSLCVPDVAYDQLIVYLDDDDTAAATDQSIVCVVHLMVLYIT